MCLINFLFEVILILFVGEKLMIELLMMFCSILWLLVWFVGVLVWDNIGKLFVCVCLIGEVLIGEVLIVRLVNVIGSVSKFIYRWYVVVVVCSDGKFCGEEYLFWDVFIDGDWVFMRFFNND